MIWKAQVSRGRRRSATHMARLAGAGLIASAILASCGSPGPTPTAGAAVPVPDDAAKHAVVLRNGDGKWDRYRSIARLRGASDCTASLVDGGVASPAADQPAYVVTAGHCLALLESNEVLVDATPAWEFTVTFDWFADTAADKRREVKVRTINWATMKGTDLAILRLDATLGELEGAGFHPFALAKTALTKPAGVVNVGAPSMGAGEAEPYLRAGTCTADATERLIREHDWTWREALRADCPDIYGGSSGSPVIDRATGEVAAVVNTTTAGSTTGADCLIHRPCEVTDGTWKVQEDTAYVMPVWRLAACFDPHGVFALGGSCQLDPGTGAAVSGVPMMANPAAPAFGTRVVATTWQAAVQGAGVVAYRTRTGPLGSTDCADESKYGPLVTVAQAPVVKDGLPGAPGIHVLCVLGYGADRSRLQAPRDAAVAATIIDTVPPPQAQVDVMRDDAGAYVVQPHFGQPDWADVWFATGPPGKVDCTDASAYRQFFTVAPRFEPGDLPVSMCVKAFDLAGNPAPVLKVDVPPVP